MSDISEQSIIINADFSTSFTFASFQNAIPVIKSISVKNLTADNIDNCTLSLVSNPPFLRAKTWKIDRLLAGSEIQLTDRKIELDAAYLNGLNEAERGEISLIFTAKEIILSEAYLPVRLLARDEWGGVSDMAQILPAFVMPNDPAIPKILRKAGEQLTAYGHTSGLDGYQSNDPARAYMLTDAIYSAISGQGIIYAEPPASFEQSGQKIRRPSDIFEQRLATCLDLTLLLAASLEAVGLNPVILLFNGHAAVGIWLKSRTLANALEPDLMEIRKALASRELVVFETTGLTHRPAMTFDMAKKSIEARLEENQKHKFITAIDIRRSRSGGITPLASHEVYKRGADDVDSYEPSTLPLSPKPSFDILPSDIVEEKPTTAQGRIDRWQSKLLDLTLKNRLLNFKNSQQTIPFLCSNVSLLEDRLANGMAIKLISLPEQNPLGERDAGLFREMRGADLQQSFAADALLRDELASNLQSKEMEKRLIELFRRVKSDFAEGGANTLFLSVGFLRWKKKPEDKDSHKAPLLLFPVKLERKSVSSRFSLRFHEDEPRFNETLIKFLERDFNLSLKQFSGALPLDESGIDVARVLSSMRQAVRDVAGMEVVDETALSTLSFAKFLMWKDLVERTDSLRKNRVVKHLIDNPESAFDTRDKAFAEEREIDRAYKPQDIVCLLPADSSQISASLAAAEGKDFVVVGPPGTGKSQTIANMIANCMAVGKTVLFVAEKTTALDVVYRRLRQNGLGNHCLELHSNKSDRKSFIGQLKQSWENTVHKTDREWVQVNERLRLKRDELNTYVEALHHRYPNGLTPYHAMGLALRRHDQYAPTLAFDKGIVHDTDTYLALAALASTLGRVYGSVTRRSSFELVEVTDWSSAWQEQFLAGVARLTHDLDQMHLAYKAFTAHIGLSEREKVTYLDLKPLYALADSLYETAEIDVNIALEHDFNQLYSALAPLKDAVSGYKEAEVQLSAIFTHETVKTLPLDKLETDWREASASLWPMSWMGKRRVKKLLESYASSGKPIPERDFITLKQLRILIFKIENNALATKFSSLSIPDSNLEAITKSIQAAGQIRSGIHNLGLSASELLIVIQAVKPALSPLSPETSFLVKARNFLTAFVTLTKSKQDFMSVANSEFLNDENKCLFTSLKDQLVELANSRQLLRDWAAWCKIKQEAKAKGLESLVLNLESGAIQFDASETAFHLAYARWWLPFTLDASPILREFRRSQHEFAIDDFRKIDDLVRKAASTKVLSALAMMPSVQSVPRQSELGLLRHQMELQKPSRSIRDMIGAMPEQFAKLAPCMLMSPLSIAQYLPSEQALFDVVIFDEASQITTWDAVGAIARGRQTIIVGDPKQLPPTNFWGGQNKEEEDVAENERDLPSILDEAKAAGIPMRDLRWHYRSRNESLIAFSNHHYYQNRLITFPSAQVEDNAVRLHPVPNGIYDRGKSKTNSIEARAVADTAVTYMQDWLKQAEDKRPTLAIITFNAPQQTLIQDFLDEARQKDPSLEWFFAEDRIEPTIVQNLENAQGQERDYVLFSITFTQDAAGKRSMDFGALNRDGGERRLNVAVTRARQELIVFSGFTADQIDTTRTKAVGVHHLKTFLDFAKRGSIALPAQEQGSVGGLESPFEEAVAAELSRLGWHLVPQVGISGFRVDIGIKHPDKAGAYLAGVECDGATYHSSATARDRDKVREQVLRGLGWNILRVWSTDWWFDAKGATARLHDALNALLEESRKPIAATLESETLVIEEISPKTQAKIVKNPYLYADLTQFEINPDSFFEFSYSLTLKKMVEHVVEVESPIRVDILAQRIARAHGWLRTGSKIREQIDVHLKGFDQTEETSGVFIWKKGTISDVVTYRNADDENHRSIPEMPIAELTSVILMQKSLLEDNDPALALARFIGVERLTTSSRARLDEALNRALTA